MCGLPRPASNGMKLNYTAILESIKKMKPRDLIYHGVFIFFLVIVAVVFFLATGFISKNINNILSFEESGEALTLDLARYTLVAKKLNIRVMTPGENVPKHEDSVAVDMAPTATTTVGTSTVPLDKSH